jgi:Ca2+-binding RTX toxin-like protein
VFVPPAAADHEPQFYCDGFTVVEGTDGPDTLTKGAGSQQMFGFAGNDTLSAGDGDDCVLGGDGNNVLNGGDGNDLIRGALGVRAESPRLKPGNDRISGGAGNDQIWGWEGNDVIDGGAGDDQIEGWSGSDTLRGGPGKDGIGGGAGPDKIDGGAGNDTITSANGVKETVHCGPGRDLVRAADPNDRLIDCERVKRVGSLWPQPTDKTFARNRGLFFFFTPRVTGQLFIDSLPLELARRGRVDGTTCTDSYSDSLSSSVADAGGFTVRRRRGGWCPGKWRGELGSQCFECEVTCESLVEKRAEMPADDHRCLGYRTLWGTFRFTVR